MQPVTKHHFLELKDACGDSAGANGLLIDQLESLATIEDDALQKRLLKELIHQYVRLEKRVDSILKNTLPASVAEEIKYEGRFLPRAYSCTILFTDFAGFTRLAEHFSMERLVDTLHTIFTHFDELVSSYEGTKIKTIGDAYMAVFGAPMAYEGHASKAIRTALAMLCWLENFNAEAVQPFPMRVGIHTGRVMAGVVGKERMQFDVFGDDVNVAARFESSGMPGKINVSETTHTLADREFDFEERGMIRLKNKADMKAYFVLAERGMQTGQ